MFELDTRHSATILVRRDFGDDSQKPAGPASWSSSERGRKVRAAPHQLVAARRPADHQPRRRAWSRRSWCPPRRTQLATEPPAAAGDDGDDGHQPHRRHRREDPAKVMYDFQAQRQHASTARARRSSTTSRTLTAARRPKGPIRRQQPGFDARRAATPRTAAISGASRDAQLLLQGPVQEHRAAGAQAGQRHADLRSTRACRPRPSSPAGRGQLQERLSAAGEDGQPRVRSPPSR